MNRSKLAGTYAAIAVILLAGCAAPQSPGKAPKTGVEEPSTPKRITAATLGILISHSRQYNPEGSVPGQSAVEELVNVGLAHVDNRGELQPQLADLVPTVENGLWKVFPDGRMEILWKLGEAARWHDGAPFSAADVLFTAEVSQDPSLPIRKDPLWRSVTNIEAPDPRTVKIEFSTPYFQADRLFTTMAQTRVLPIPKHLLEEPFRQDKEGFLRLPYWTREIVGTGPYRLREWVEGSHIALDAYDRYVLGRPKIDEIVIRFIPDGNTMIANILAGEVDLVLERGLSLDQAMQIRQNWANGRVDMVGESWVAAYPQHIDPSPPIVADPRFKRALLHAADRQEMVDTIMQGVTGVAHAIVQEDRGEYPFVKDRIVRYKYDPRKAVQMIEGLGYARGADNLFRDVAGQVLSVEGRAGGGSLDIQNKAVFALGEYWKRVGVNMEYTPTRGLEREAAATFPGFRIVRQGTDLPRLRNFDSRQAPTAANRFTGSNYPRYQDPAFDALLERFLASVLRAERMQALGDVLHHMTDQVVNLPLFYDIEAAPVSNRLLVATVRRGAGSTQAWDAHLWDIN